MKVLFSCTHHKFATHWTFLTWRWRCWRVCITTPNFQTNSHPNTLSIYLYYIFQRPLFLGTFCFGNTQSPLHFGEIEKNVHSLQIQGTLFRNVATNIWTHFHALNQRPLLFACSLSPNTQGLWVPAILYNQHDQHTSSSIHHILYRLSKKSWYPSVDQCILLLLK